MVLAAVDDISRAICDQKIKNVCSKRGVRSNVGRTADELVEIMVVYIVKQFEAKFTLVVVRIPSSATIIQIAKKND
jgi:hypothetical protein